MVPLALGSQTGGSTILPAAFLRCGRLQFEFDRRLTAAACGICAPTLDTMGLFARSIADIAVLRSVLTGLKPGAPVITLEMSGSAFAGRQAGIRLSQRR